MRVLLNFDGLRNVILVWILLALGDWAVTQYFFQGLLRTSDSRWASLPFTDAGSALFLIYQVLIALSGLSHLSASVADPGIVAGDVEPYGVVFPRGCRRCSGSWKPPRSHHCVICKRCIFRMDHHCIWINNCVGLGNQKVFVLFLSYTVAASSLTAILLACCVLHRLAYHGLRPEAEPRRSTLAFLALGVLGCVGAVLFASEFLKEQWVSIRTNCTVVESYMGTRGPWLEPAAQLRVVFGGRRWAWPLPVPAAPDVDLSEPAVEVDGGRDPLDADECKYLGIAGVADEGPYLGNVAEQPGPSVRRLGGGAGGGASARRRRNQTPPPPLKPREVLEID